MHTNQLQTKQKQINFFNDFTSWQAFLLYNLNSTQLNRLGIQINAPIKSIVLFPCIRKHWKRNRMFITLYLWRNSLSSAIQ